jgi:hypothetical protein
MAGVAGERLLPGLVKISDKHFGLCHVVLPLQNFMLRKISLPCVSSLTFFKSIIQKTPVLRTIIHFPLSFEAHGRSTE